MKALTPTASRGKAVVAKNAKISQGETAQSDALAFAAAEREAKARKRAEAAASARAEAIQKEKLRRRAATEAASDGAGDGPASADADDAEFEQRFKRWIIDKKIWKANLSGRGIFWNLDLAVMLAGAGLYVFPCDPNKRPLTAHGFKCATNDVEGIRGLWRDRNGVSFGQFRAMPAIDLGRSDLIVIDPDTMEGVAAFEAFCAQHGISLDGAPVVETPSGGRHIYLRQRTGAKRISCSRGDLPPKSILNVDVKGDGGYVVAPGAYRIGGEFASGAYRIKGDVLAILNAPEIPATLHAVLTREPGNVAQANDPMASTVSTTSPTISPALAAGVPPVDENSPRVRAYVASAIEREITTLSTTGVGGRNIQLNASAFALYQFVGAKLLDDRDVHIKLVAAAEACGLIRSDGRSSVLKTIASGRRAGLAQPRKIIEEFWAEEERARANGEEQARALMRLEDGALADASTGEIIGEAPRPAKKSPPRPEPVIFSARALDGMEFPDIKYVVPKFIAEGLTILAGKPKIGKSWLVMDIALAVASGGQCLGEPCEQGSALYLALEDNQRRLQSRMRKLWQAEMLCGREFPEALDFSVEWPRTNDGGVEAIRKWINGHFDARLVVVDVLAQVKPLARGRDQAQYEHDYLTIKALQSLASETRVAIVVIHHTRKWAEVGDPFEKISGTLGLSGAADAALILDRGPEGATLYGRGRDVEEIEAAVRFDHATCRWEALGDATEVRRSDERKKVMAVLEEAHEAVGAADIVRATGGNRNAIDVLLHKMAKAGEVVRVSRGKYALPGLAPFNAETPEDDSEPCIEDGDDWPSEADADE